MTNAYRQQSSLPVESNNDEPSGQYRMVTPRAQVNAPHRRRISGEYLDAPVVTSIDSRRAKSQLSAKPSAKPKVIQLEALDDAFGDELDEFAEQNAPDAPDSLVQMMEGLEGTRMKEEAWPKQPLVPKAPSIPRMEAVQAPPGPLQMPISRMTPSRPQVSEHQVIGDFAKFGTVPTSFWQMPGYAFHVRARKEQLKRELGMYRERRPADVELYEKAVRHADDDAVKRGWMVLAGSAVLGVLVIVIICMLL